MVYSSSVPVYLDHHNWQQQPSHDNLENPPPPQPPQVGGSSGDGPIIRPGSMVDRARLAKLPLPEAGLNCPRCDSTNTKFCYFNNYNLAQPRHFCKTCRRYWTRGGALRSVPVGGGCRKNNKRSNKCRSTSKSPITTPSDGHHNSVSASPSSCSTEKIMTGHGDFQVQPSLQQSPLVASLQNQLPRYGNTGGLIQPQMMGFPIGTSSNVFSTAAAGGGAGGWRLPPLLATSALEAPPFNLSPYQANQRSYEARSGSIIIGDSLGVLGTTPMKMEADQTHHHDLSLSARRSFFGMSSENTNTNQYWGAAGNAWTEFSGLNSSNSSACSQFL
ncbi:hypothetical protein RJ639_044244 [Escallonia herrerae]|uniref:Dof zinc finger protein n=1 Tax=Escallonia herrerae TaxID=1293975 RepID=A0AA88WC15_9ASTE|nr:hypothetical protein RJ639_044244 [Escallonia herrerae]